ncbi:MAG: FHA domain-containing protein [Clostridiaceae bacterium]|nr:FHA domain-containing protein [Clostridiaceae bacterium]
MQVSVRQASTETGNRKIWNFYLNHSAAGLPLADPEQEIKILRYPPSELLPCNWYLKRNILTVQIDDRNLKALIELDSKSMRKSDLGLERFLSVVRSCERLEEELLSVEEMFLHPELIYFSACAKILALPLPPGIISAGTHQSKHAKTWIFSSADAKDRSNSGPAGLLSWMAKYYSIDNEVVRELMPLCWQGNYRKLRLALSGDRGEGEDETMDPDCAISGREELKCEDSSEKDLSGPVEGQENSDKKRKKTMDISADTKKIEKNTPEVKAKDKKQGGLFSGLRSIYLRDFQQAEKTADLVLEDPFFRMACLSEGLPGTKEEKLGHRAFILVDEFLIGRDSDLVDFWIDSQNVSRQHARISRRQGSFFLEDLGSRNSTLLDGKKVNKHKEYLLPDKCRLTFADKAYYFEASS